jgi:hypothetical protein
MPTVTAGALGVDFDQIEIGALAIGQVTQLGSSSFIISTRGEQDQFSGRGFVFGGGGLPSAGLIIGLTETLFGRQAFQLTGLNLAATDLNSWVASGSSEAAKVAIFAGADEIDGSDATDLRRGYRDDDTINGSGGNDTESCLPGADIFRGSQDGGINRVRDFSQSEATE